MLWPQGGGVKKMGKRMSLLKTPEPARSVCGRQTVGFQRSDVSFQVKSFMNPPNHLGNRWNIQKPNCGSDYYHALHKIACLKTRLTQPSCFAILRKSQFIMVWESAQETVITVISSHEWMEGSRTLLFPDSIWCRVSSFKCSKYHRNQLKMTQLWKTASSWKEWNQHKDCGENATNPTHCK